jgi:hypothetical protein
MRTKQASPESRTNPGTVPAPHHTSPVVMDVLPWPSGYGFTGGDTWWQYVSNQTERERLDNLVGLALLDNKACEQLVTKRDPFLLSAFGLSEQTQNWLRGIKASTLRDLAQAIVAVTQLPHLDTTG